MHHGGKAAILSIDTRMSLETPEGIALPLYPAGIWLRILAYSIDWLVRGVAIIAVAVIFSGSGLAQGASLITMFLLEWFYPVAFEVWRGGQTIGKKAVGLKVVNDDGTPITFSSSLLRNLLRVVDFLPMFYFAGIIASVANRQFKRLGDLAAGTLVVYNRQSAAPPQVEDVGSTPAPIFFDTEEQRSLVAFSQRSQTMTSARQAELAQILSPLLKGPDPALTIKQIANSIVGKR